MEWEYLFSRNGHSITRGMKWPSIIYEMIVHIFIRQTTLIYFKIILMLIYNKTMLDFQNFYHKNILGIIFLIIDFIEKHIDFFWILMKLHEYLF